MWRDADSKSITNPSAKTSASSHFYYKPSKNSTIEELEEKQINQLSVNLPFMVIIHLFISVTVPKPHWIKNPSPTQIIMFSFGQFLQQKWAQNIRHLYVINQFFVSKINRVFLVFPIRILPLFLSKTNTHIVAKKKCRKIKVCRVKSNKGCEWWIYPAPTLYSRILGASSACSGPRGHQGALGWAICCGHPQEWFLRSSSFISLFLILDMPTMLAIYC